MTNLYDKLTEINLNCEFSHGKKNMKNYQAKQNVHEVKYNW